MILTLNPQKQLAVEENKQKPFAYTKSLISEMINDGYVALSNDQQLIKLANSYNGYAVSVLKDNKVLDAVVIFFVVNFLDQQSLVLNDALADENLALEENFDIYFDYEIIGIYPQLVFNPCDFSIKKIIKQCSDFDFYYQELLESETESLDDLDESDKNILLDYKMSNNAEQKELLLDTLVNKTGYQIDILKALAHKISAEPKLNLVTKRS
jgi:hypothetical protein